MQQPNVIDFSQVDQTNPQDFVLIQKIIEEFPNLPPETHRHLVRNRESNGLSPVIKKIGKYLYANRIGYGYWLANV